MKKALMMSLLTVSMVSVAQTDDQTLNADASSDVSVNDEALERAKDHAQPVPEASVTTRIVNENTSTIIASDGNSAVSTTTSITVDNSATGEMNTVSSSEIILPTPRIINDQMDWGQTLDKMDALLSTLAKADNIAAMKIPSGTLNDYAGQAAILLSSDQYSGANVEQVTDSLTELRVLAVELQRAIIANDLTLAQSKVSELLQAQHNLR